MTSQWCHNCTVHGVFLFRRYLNPWVRFIATKYLRPQKRINDNLFFNCYFNNHSIITNELRNSWIKSNYTIKLMVIKIKHNFGKKLTLIRPFVQTVKFRIKTEERDFGNQFKYQRNKKPSKTVQSLRHQKSFINRQVFTKLL